MKLLFAFVLAMLMQAAAVAADTPSQATDSAKAWLALVDAGQFEQSWQQASALFKSRVSQAQWTAAAKPLRESLGAVVSRVPAVSKTATSLPGAPDGQYVIVQFHTKFAKKSESVETVTMMMDSGAWKCAGYFIK